MPTRMLRDWTDSDAFDGVSAEAERMFVRLLMKADDYGRFYGDERRLKSALFPLSDTLRTNDLIRWRAELAHRQLILCYEVGTRQLLTINRFRQRLKNSVPKFPPPDGKPIDWRLDDADFQLLPASSDNSPELPAVSRSRSRSRKDQLLCASPVGDAPRDGELPLEQTPPIPYQAIADAYNRELTRLPKIRSVGPDRCTLIRQAWHSDPSFQSVGFWADYFAACEADPFRNGTGPYLNGHENWRPDFDYLMRVKVVRKLVERVATPEVAA